MTLVFGFAQAVASAQYGARLISPFPGRVLDFEKKLSGGDRLKRASFAEEARSPGHPRRIREWWRCSACDQGLGWCLG